MTVSLAAVVLMAVLYAAGIYLMLERSLTRVLLGFLLVGNATNLLLLVVSGAPGVAPIVHGRRPAGEYADPLPQALALTAIVITFGVSAFLLALIYRSWRLGQADRIDDDVEDVAVRERIAGLSEEPASGMPPTDFIAVPGPGDAAVDDPEPDALAEAQRADLEAALDRSADDDDRTDFRPQGGEG